MKWYWSFISYINKCLKNYVNYVNWQTKPNKFDKQSQTSKWKKALGTRWTVHKIGAMIACLDNWGTYIQHLKNLAEDTSNKPKDCQKMKGSLKTWSRPNTPHQPFGDTINIVTLTS